MYKQYSQKGARSINALTDWCFSAHLWVLYNCLRIKCSPKNVDLQHCLLSQLWRQWRSPHLSQLTRSSRARLRTTSPATRMVTCSGHKMAPATSCWVRDPASTTAREEATLFYTEQANVLILPRQKECFSQVTKKILYKTDSVLWRI